MNNLGFSPHLKIINLITSAKTCFTNKVIFTGSQDVTWSIFCGAIFHPTTEVKPLSTVIMQLAEVGFEHSQVWFSVHSLISSH